MLKPIYTQRLVIRKLEDKDVYPLYAYRHLDEVKKYQSWDYYSLAKAQNLVNKVKSQMFNFTFGSTNFAVEYNGNLIGDLYLMIDYMDVNHAIIGYTFNPDYWHNGFAYEAVSALIDLLVNKYHKTTISAYVKEGNVASMRLLIRLNFRLEDYNESYGDYRFELRP